MAIEKFSPEVSVSTDQVDAPAIPTETVEVKSDAEFSEEETLELDVSNTTFESPDIEENEIDKSSEKTEVKTLKT